MNAKLSSWLKTLSSIFGGRWFFPVIVFVPVPLAAPDHARASEETESQAPAAPERESDSTGTAVQIDPESLVGRNEQYLINRVEIEGLGRTESHVVLRELTFAPGQPVTRAAVEESVQRIRNLQIFTTVEYELVGQTLRLTLKEKWTTIPIFKVSGGGGQTRFTIGAYDVNVLGYYQEVGGQYERLGDENSGVIWYRNPRFLGKRLELFMSLWSITRSETVYEDLGRKNKIESALLVEREKASVSLEKEWTSWLRVGAGLEFNMDKCDPNLIGVTDPSMVSQILADHEEETTALIPGTVIKLGRIDHNNYRVDGVLFEHRLQSTGSALGSSTQFTSNDVQLLGYRTLFADSTLALRLGAGVSDTRSSQYYYFLGGLDRIRGFEAGRFYGRNYWLGNLEMRVPLIDQPLYVIQATGFADALGVSLDRRDLDDVTAASTGLGLRLIAPTVYRLVLRLDYAVPLKSDGMQPLSFGIQQFF